MIRFILLPALIITLLTLVNPFVHAQPKSKKVTTEKATPTEEKEIVILETSLGKIEFELYRKDAPKTVENFVKLAEQKYFDGVKFHRIAKGFVIQGGDPTGTGGGGKSIYGKEFPDELNPFSASYQKGYLKGTVAMANRGPNTNTSQFFILLNDAPWLPKNYTIFGKVVSGMEVVDAIGSVEIIPMSSANDGRPKTDVLMNKVSVKKAGSSSQ